MDIKDLMNDKLRDAPIDEVRGGLQASMKAEQLNASISKALPPHPTAPSKPDARLERTQHCYAKDGDAYRGLLYQHQMTDSDLHSSQRFLEDTAGGISSCASHLNFE